MAKKRNPMAGKTFHYYGSSIAEWRVDSDLTKLIKFFERDSYPYVIWLVPVAEEAHYQIEHYAPQVPGSICIWSTIDSDLSEELKELLQYKKEVLQAKMENDLEGT